MGCAADFLEAAPICPLYANADPPDHLVFVLAVVIVMLRGEGPRLKAAFGNRKTLGYLSLTAALLATNWIVYIWALNNGHLVEASLGYFINPLVSVLMGVVFLRERLRPVQWGVVGLAAVGVGYLWRLYGAPPWIALALAGSFGLTVC